MSRPHFRLTLLLLLLGAGVSFAQTNVVSTNAFSFTFAPPTNTVLIAGTTNAMTLQISNIGDFTNVTASATVGPTLVNLNETTPISGIFTNKLIAPTNVGQLTVSVTISAIDLTATNLVPTPTNAVTLTTNFTKTYLVVARPPNDNFANAIKIPALGGTIFGSNTYASLEPGEPQHGGDPFVAASVWWVWTPPVSESVLIDTAGSAFSPVLGIYTGGAVGGLTAVASSTNDVADNLKANVVFQTVAGQTYYIAVAGWDSSTNGSGQIELRVLPGHLPDTGLPQITIVAPEADFVTATNRVVLQGVAKDDGFNDTGVAAVYVQVNGGTNLLAFSSTNGVGSTAWTLAVSLPIGADSITAYAVDLAGNVSAPYAIVVNYIYPVNTLFGSATALSGLSGTVFDNTTNAVFEPGQPLIAGTIGAHTVWWTFLAPNNGTLTLTTAGSSFDTVLGVFTGNNVTNLTPVASNDDATPSVTYSALSTAVSSNILYDIAVDGYAGATGNVTLTYTFTPASPNGTNAPPVFYSVTALAGLGGSVTGGGSYVSNSTVTLTATPSADYGFSEWQGGAGLGISTKNPLVLNGLKSNETWTALFAVTNFTDTFQGGSLTNIGWISAGNLPWFVQTNYVPTNAAFAAQSGAIGNSQSSSLLLTTNNVSGLGSFEYLVSSESGWDFLQFYTNGVLAMEVSGQTVTNWTTFSFPVAAGTNTFEFTYVKDPTISLGLDAGFVANFYVPLVEAPAVSTNAAALLNVVSSGPPFQLLLSGQAGITYITQASVDLSTWVNISTNVAAGPLLITDSQSSSLAYRFYRAVAP